MGRRIDALRLGHHTYEGKPCGACEALGIYNSTTRYSSSGGCIACAQRRNSADPLGAPQANPRKMTERNMSKEMRAIAQMTGASTYEGGECIHCGTRERYTSNGACKHCANERNKTRSKANTERRHVMHLSPLLRVEAGKFRDCEHTAAMNQVLPELQGASLVYARCPQTEHLMERVPHYGRCVLCYPDALINISNQIVWGNLPGLDAETVSFITRLCKVPFNSGTPYSLATLCMAAYNKRLGHTPAQLRKLPPLALPGGDA